MKLIKVAAAIINQTPFDWDNNVTNIRAAITAAKEQGATILCLPELCITGYGCEDDFFRTDLRERAVDVLFELLPETRDMIVSFGLPVSFNNSLFNCAALAVDGHLVGLVAKQNLAGDGIHYEPRWFEAWPERTLTHIVLKGDKYPLGDLFFDIGGIKIGFEICEDAWVGRRPGSNLAGRGVDVILNPSASHFAMGKFEIRKRLVLEGSRAFSTNYIYTNLLGNDAGRAIYDGGAIIASAGKMVAIGPRLGFSDCVVTAAVVDVDHTRMSQSRTFSYRPDLSDPGETCIEMRFDFPDIAPPVMPPFLDQAPWENSFHVREEELARSVALGLFDYMRKSKSNGYVVSLSGGADSASVACLVSLMVELGVQSLGLDEFKKKLSYLRQIQDAKSEEELISKLLTCAYQATKNSSESTRDAARQIAEYIHARFLDLDVEPIVQQYICVIEKSLGRKLSWETDDIALQNIQARVRSPGVWLLANLSGALLVSTSNRSEGAVGYCTMDGDTSGGLAPIAGVDKHFIRRWLRWMEREGPNGLHAYTGLSAVNRQVPGPELRPQEMMQSGESDLMPYDLLDAIEEAAIENNQSVSDCYRLMRVRFPQFEPKLLATWIERFFRLWSRNQWKRERLAPALHVASRNLDPRTWRRSPILSGGFAKEIKEMWEVATAETSSLKKAPDRTDDALIIVDAQKGFGSNGELPVPRAEEIVPVINSLISHFSLVVATQDWHPQNHISFAQTHGKNPGDTISMGRYEQPLFPVHCVAGSRSCEFLDGLNTAAFARIFQKGNRSEMDCFSAFIDNLGGKATDLEDYLKKKHVKRVYVVGLATNYCVEATALDALKLGFEVFLVEEACRGVEEHPGAVEASLVKMKKAGIKVVSAANVLSTVKSG